MLVPMLFMLVQQPQPQAAAPSPVARVEVTPASAEVQVGQTLQMHARALGADGQPVPAAQIRWFAGGNGGIVDSTGLVKGGFIGTAQVTAVAVVSGTRNTLGRAEVRIVPAPAARVEIESAPARAVVGTRLTLRATAYSAQGD
ncbi:MAG TPA: Ig-like domain-containing protein, partial [Gemmatimonadales bacterium]|nr:Ig-like domain-containing protein [Gemmatimonadales bacterium]